LQAGGGVGQDGSNRWKGWSEPGGSLMDEDILPPCARLTSRCPSAPGSDAHLDSRRRSGRGEGDRAPAGRHTAEERHRTARCGASEPRGGQGQAGRGHGQGLHRQGTVPAAGSQLECHNKNSKKRRKHRSLAECRPAHLSTYRAFDHPTSDRAPPSAGRRAGRRLRCRHPRQLAP
jgi:hypothetical protein